MKLRILRYAVLAVAVIFTWSCTGENAGGRSETLRIMTFNIRYGSAKDGDNAWENRKHLVVDVIRHFTPSILGVQEALYFQLEELKTAFPMYKQVGVGRDDGMEAGEYSAIFYNIYLRINLFDCRIVIGMFLPMQKVSAPSMDSQA